MPRTSPDILPTPARKPRSPITAQPAPAYIPKPAPRYVDKFNLKDAEIEVLRELQTLIKTKLGRNMSTNRLSERAGIGSRGSVKRLLEGKMVNIDLADMMARFLKHRLAIVPLESENDGCAYGIDAISPCTV
jgi:hypothetical protein